MDKKATLLVKNLHCIYTLENEQTLSKQKGFIAIHHDEILDLGEHSYDAYVDSDTRMIDGTNHIAIPAFIEPCAKIPSQKESMREYDEFFMRYMHNGTLTIQLDRLVEDVFYKEYHYTLLQKQRNDEVEILYALEQMRKPKLNKQEAFCISCSDEKISLQNQMLAAQMLAMKENIDAYELLKALTIHPAKLLGLSNQGVLRKGALANILILSSLDINSFFYSLDQAQIAQIIHKGVRIYPNLII